MHRRYTLQVPEKVFHPLSTLPNHTEINMAGGRKHLPNRSHPVRPPSLPCDDKARYIFLLVNQYLCRNYKNKRKKLIIVISYFLG
jgi:hypothetical protein